MTACERISELIPWYANGSLSADAMIEVTKHMATCPSCSEELAETLRIKRAVDAEVRSMPTLSPAVRRRVGASAMGRPIARVDLGSFLLGFSLGARVHRSGVPVRGDLRVLGRKIQLFDVGKEE